jgi:hypothetical protein
MRLAVWVVVLAAWLAGCSSGDEVESPEPTPTSAPALTMRDICPMVEDALPKGFGAGVGNFRAFADKLDSLHNRADPEARNAVEEAQAGTRKIIKTMESGKTGLFASEGEEAFIDGLTALAGRCKAAGSSALQ